MILNIPEKVNTSKPEGSWPVKDENGQIIGQLQRLSADLQSNEFEFTFHCTDSKTVAKIHSIINSGGLNVKVTDRF